MITNGKQIQLRNYVLGDGKLALILPIIPRNAEELVSMAKNALTMQPDIIEWRIDYFDDCEDLDAVAEALHLLRGSIADTALMVTPRHIEENGVRDIDENTKFALLKRIVEERQADMVDVELRYGVGFIGKLHALCAENGCALMVSYHDTVKTPGESEILQKLREEVAAGADVCKVSFLANSYGDVCRLGKAVLNAKKGEIVAPIVSISAGPIGMFARIEGDKFGSDGTFVSGGDTYQININDFRLLRDMMQMDSNY